MTRRRIPARERIGQRFNRLVILEILPGGRCRAKCDCGNESTPMLGSVVRGSTKACGCLEGSQMRTHGESRSRLYSVRLAMIARCTNPKNIGWKDYGGRGISVCASWLSSWEAFRDDVGPDPGSHLTLDRQDNGGGYWCGKCAECVSLGRPSNVRWATRGEQASNTRRALRQDQRTLIEEARQRGVSRQLLESRKSRGVTGADLLAPPNSLGIHCSRCGNKGHNVKTCPERLAELHARVVTRADLEAAMAAAGYVL